MVHGIAHLNNKGHSQLKKIVTLKTSVILYNEFEYFFHKFLLSS